MDKQPFFQPSEKPAATTLPQKPKRRILIPLLISIVVAAAAAGGIYYWQQQKVRDLQRHVTSLNTRVTGLSNQLAAANTAIAKGAQPAATQPAAGQSTDDQVLAAVKNYCNANVDPATKQPLVLTVGTAGPSQKHVLYSADKNFAYVNAICSNDGTTEGSGAAYYLKKVNGSWVFLYRGQMASAEYTAQFNIPGEFN